jgi:hypothetical protein
MYFFQIVHSKFCDKCPVEAINGASHKFGGCKGEQIKHNKFRIRRNGFPVIPLGVLRGKAMKKNSKKEKEGELWPLINATTLIQL